MSCQRSKLSLLVNEEQRQTIISLFGYYDWYVSESEDSNRQLVKQETQTDIVQDVDGHLADSNLEEPFIIPQNPDSVECQFCLCKPCITHESNRQLWWENECQEKHRRNNGLRKDKYKYFWTMLFHRQFFRDDRYQDRKLEALSRDPKFKNYIWHKRDLMPNCVLKLVRGWHPNPDEIPYMGHLWE